MTHFPLFLDVKDKEIIIFGGGLLAREKIEKHRPFSPKITVISDQISDDIKEIDGISIKEREFSPKDLEIHPAFVIIAESEEKTEYIYSECKRRHIHVNAVDMPKYCDIIFPSVIATNHLCIGISSGGISPTATVKFKKRIGELIPDNIDAILEWMLPVREYINTHVPKDSRKTALRKIFNAALEKNQPLNEDEVQIIISNE